MKKISSNRLIWFGVLGGGLSWLVEFVAILEATWFTCEQPGRWDVPLHGLQIGIGAAALVVGLLSTFVAGRVFLQTWSDRDLSHKVHRGFGGDPPAGRVHFLAVVGLVVNVVALMIIVMTTIGGPQLLLCQQS